MHLTKCKGELELSLVVIQTYWKRQQYIEHIGDHCCVSREQSTKMILSYLSTSCFPWQCSESVFARAIQNGEGRQLETNKLSISIILAFYRRCLLFLKPHMIRPVTERRTLILFFISPCHFLWRCPLGNTGLICPRKIKEA